MFYPRGEEAAARAAGAAGTAYILSTLSGCRLEDVQGGDERARLWYQLYLVGGRDVALGGDRSARAAAGYSALVVTIDTPVAGHARARRPQRHRRSSLAAQLVHDAALRAAVPGAARAGSPRFLGDGGLMKFPNVVLPDGGPMPYADVGAALEQSVGDVGRLRVDSRGLERADRRQGRAHRRRRAARGGRGRRRRSSCRTTAAGSSTASRRRCACCRRWSRRWAAGSRCCSTAASAAAATSSRRCASARAPCSIGRAYAYGLAAGGQAGVARAIDILRTDIVRTMKLLGCPERRAVGT